MAGDGDSDAYYTALSKKVVAAGGTRRGTVPADSAAPFVTGPCSKEDFKRNSATNQLNTCTRMAASWMGITMLSDIKGIDTHAFDRTMLDGRDRKIYFHVTYSGKMPDNSKRFFFAELIGYRGPERVTTVIELHGGDFSVNNCTFCTGMWHPDRGGFAGYTGQDS